MAFQKYLEKTMPKTHLQWDRLHKQEATEEEKQLQKQELQSAAANILQDITEAIAHILQFMKELQTQTNCDTSKIVLREDCNPIIYFCQCMERLLLFGFQKRMFRSYVWSFIAVSSSKCFLNCQQLEADINLIKSITILNDIGRLRAFLRQSFRSKNIPFYFELIFQQTDIIQLYYTDFSIMKHKNKLNQLLIELNKLNNLPENVEFQMLLNDISLNVTEYFERDQYGIPQWIITQNKSYKMDDNNDMIEDIISTKYSKKKKRKNSKKNKQKSKRTLYNIRSTDDTMTANIDDDVIKLKKNEVINSIEQKNDVTIKEQKDDVTYAMKEKKKKSNSRKKKHKDRKKVKLMILNDKNQTSDFDELITAISTISKLKNSKSKNANFLNSRSENMIVSKTENKEMIALKQELKMKDEKIKLLQSDLEKMEMERNEYEQQCVQQQDEMSNLRSKIIILEDKLQKTKQLLPHNTLIPSNDKKEKEFEDCWRNTVQIRDKIDYKLNINVWSVWTTARIISYYENDYNALKIRLVGWNADNFEDEMVVDRDDENVSKYHSKTGVVNHNNDNILFEGIMSKEGGSWKTWKRRYFMLDFQGNMRYYSQKGEKEWIKQFNIKTALTKIEKEKKYLYVTTEERTWKFLCKNGKELIKWLNAINFAKQYT